MILLCIDLNFVVEIWNINLQVVTISHYSLLSCGSLWQDKKRTHVNDEIMYIFNFCMFNYLDNVCLRFIANVNHDCNFVIFALFCFVLFWVNLLVNAFQSSKVGMRYYSWFFKSAEIHLNGIFAWYIFIWADNFTKRFDGIVRNFAI